MSTSFNVGSTLSTMAVMVGDGRVAAMFARHLEAMCL